MVKTRFVILAALAVCAVAAFSPNAWACNGACCLPDGSCTSYCYRWECEGVGGVWHGDLYWCSQVDCGTIPLECRMTGGGVDTSGRWDGTYANGAENTDRYTFGGQVGAPRASQPQPSGEWTHHQQSGPDGNWVFHAGTASAPAETEIDLVTCSDPGWCEQARPAPAKQIDYEGVGQFKNIKKAGPLMGNAVAGQTFHWFEVHVEDLGEPGRGGKVEPPANFCPSYGTPGGVANCDCPDYYQITIHDNIDPGSAIIYQVHGYITGGNLQIHPPIQ